MWQLRELFLFEIRIIYTKVPRTYCVLCKVSKHFLTSPRYFHTHDLKDVSAIISAFRWAERFWIRALQSARKVNWSRCFSPARCTIADCPYAGVPVWGVLLWGLAGGVWRPDTYHRDRVLEDRGVEDASRIFIRTTAWNRGACNG